VAGLGFFDSINCQEADGINAEFFEGLGDNDHNCFWNELQIRQQLNQWLLDGWEAPQNSSLLYRYRQEPNLPGNSP
jgi:hypothetical protein